MPSYLHGSKWQAPATLISLTPSIAWSLDTDMVQGGCPYIYMALNDNGSSGINSDPCCCRVTNLDMAICSTPGLDDIMTPGGRPDHHSTPHPSIGTVFDGLRSHRYQHRP